MAFQLTRLVRSATASAARRVFISRPLSSSINAHAADKFVVEFPEEREGLHIEFNWSLADDDITPYGDAYRNLSWPKLEALAKGAAPAGKAVAVQEVDVDVAYSEFEAAYEQVTAHLSQQDNTFTQDGAVGSYKDDRSRVRVISDSPLAALFAQSLLVRVPIKDPHAARPIVVYVAMSGEFATQEPKAYLLVDKDEQGEAFTKIVISGAADLTSLQSAIGLAKTKLVAHSESASVVLPADVLIKGDKTALVFNSTAEARTQAVNSGLLYGAHLNIWNSVGLTSVFGGAVTDSKVAKKQVLALANGAAVHVPCNNLVNAPKAAIFVQTGAKAKSITPAEAAALLQKADANADTEKFEALLKKAGTSSFVVASATEAEATLAKL